MLFNLKKAASPKEMQLCLEEIIKKMRDAKNKTDSLKERISFMVNNIANGLILVKDYTINIVSHEDLSNDCYLAIATNNLPKNIEKRLLEEFSWDRIMDGNYIIKLM